MTNTTNNTQLAGYEEFIQALEKNWRIFVVEI